MGNTLIGCMVVSKMLEQNPTRQVIFLVDRGLLVLQQYQYIKRELGSNTLFNVKEILKIYLIEQKIYSNHQDERFIMV
jgi:ERCC4-related helicase